MPRISTIVVFAAIGYLAAYKGPEVSGTISEALARTPPQSAISQQTTASYGAPLPSVVRLGDPAPMARSGPGIISGPVQRIADGDTFTVRGQRIRICGIDAPEMNSAAGKRSRDAMVGLVSGRSVTCTIVGYGTPCDGRSSARSYDRVVAQCHVDGRDVAWEMVRRGHASDWARYSGGHYR